MAIDSSGIKVSPRGEWIREIYPERKRKGWLKLHVAIDVQQKRLVGIEVTDERVHDREKFNALLNDILKVGKPAKLLADSAYDSRESFNLLHKLGIEPGIKPRRVLLVPKAGKG